jgi:hypothetical protein
MRHGRNVRVVRRRLWSRVIGEHAAPLEDFEEARIGNDDVIGRVSHRWQ